MKVKLHIKQGDKPVRVLTVRGPEAIFGRAHGNAVRIPSHAVSRRHCRLVVRETRVTIEDLQSLNGTFLNAQRVEGVREVRPGDRLQVGPVTFLVDFVIGNESASLSPREQEEPDLIDPEEIDVTLEEPAAPPTQSEMPTAKRPSAGPGLGRPRRNPAASPSPDGTWMREPSTWFPWPGTSLLHKRTRLPFPRCRPDRLPQPAETLPQLEPARQPASQPKRNRARKTGTTTNQSR